MRKMCLLSFLLLLLTLPFLVHGSASAQTETLRVMVYDRENMPEEYGSCEDNAWVRYIQSRVLRELDIDLQFVRVKRADDVAQINLLAGQNEPPDIMFTYEYDFWLTLCRNGLVADITDELEENGSYLKRSAAVWRNRRAAVRDSLPAQHHRCDQRLHPQGLAGSFGN